MDVGLVVGVHAQVPQEALSRVWEALHLCGESVRAEHDEAVVCHAGPVVVLGQPVEVFDSRAMTERSSSAVTMRVERKPPS